MLQRFTKDHSGFTLIELLVVIAIIGILAGIVLISLNDAREKARDSRRIGVLRQAQVALESYFDDHGEYFAGSSPPPGGSCESAEGPGNLFDAIGLGENISDPLDDRNYVYSGATVDGTDYVLGADLEDNDHPALDTDIDNEHKPVLCDECDCDDNDTDGDYFVAP